MLNVEALEALFMILWGFMLEGGSGTFTVEAAARADKGMLIALDIQKAVVSTLMKRLSEEDTTVNVVPRTPFSASYI